MSITRIFFVMAVVVGLSACSDVKSKEWYAENPEAAAEKLVECLMEGNASDDECQNALKSQVPNVKALSEGVKSAIEKE